MALLVGASFLAGRQTVGQASPVVPDLRTEATFIASAGKVERVRRVTVDFPRTVTSMSAALLGGTVTRLGQDGANDALIIAAPGVFGAVDEVPLVAALGEVPAYRDLGADTRGPDVRQLQRWLRESGYLGTGSEADGLYDASTTDAVRGWEEATGQAPDGIVPLGQIVFTPGFPVEVSSRQLVAGAPSPTLLSLEIPTAVVQPSFQVGGGEWSDLAIGQNVVVDRGGESFELEIEEFIRDVEIESGWRVLLSPLEGGEAALVRGTRLEGLVEVVPPTEGVLLPPAAVGQDVLGSFVVSGSGERIGVDVKATGDGVVVVEGVAPGAVVRITPVLDEEFSPTPSVSVSG